MNHNSNDMEIKKKRKQQQQKRRKSQTPIPREANFIKEKLASIQLIPLHA